MVTTPMAAGGGPSRPDGLNVPAAPARYTGFLSALEGHTGPRPANTQPTQEPLTGPRVHPRASDSHRFLVQALRYLTDHGVHQYVTIGAGEPARHAFQEAARTVDPWARTALVDIGTGQLILLHTLSHAGQTQDQTPVTATPATATPSTPAGHEQADLLSPARLWPAATEAGVDLTRPVALVIIGVLHHLPDDTLAQNTVSRLVRALPEGSYLVATHASSDHPSCGLRAAERAYTLTGLPFRPRTRDEVTHLLTGLDLIDPGVQLLPAWHDGTTHTTTPETPPTTTDPIACWGTIGQVRPHVDGHVDVTADSTVDVTSATW